MTSWSLRPGETGEESAGALNAVLRIAGDPDDRLRDAGNFWRTARRSQSYITHFKSLMTVRNTQVRQKENRHFKGDLEVMTLPMATDVSTILRYFR